MEFDTAPLARMGSQRMRAVLRLKEIDEAILPSVIAAKNAGISEERIAALAGITRGTVRNWLKRTTETEA